MYRIIKSSTDDDNKYAYSTRRDEMNFDHPVVFSLQFIKGPGFRATYDEEAFILAHNYNEAYKIADRLCNILDYHDEGDRCTVQYAYKSLDWWDAADAHKRDIGGIEVVSDYELKSVTAATTVSDMIGEVANAKQELKKFDKEKVQYVKDCYAEVLRAIADYYEQDDEYDITPVNVDTIKTDYLIGAIEDDLMTEDEFNYIYDLLDTIGQEDAWAVS